MPNIVQEIVIRLRNDNEYEKVELIEPRTI